VGAAGAVVLIESSGAVTPPMACAAKTGGPDLTFFDPRFARARVLALELAKGGELAPVSGDPTDLVMRLESLAQAGPVRGVTVESVPFCLRQFHPRAVLKVHRVDRDLFAWEIQQWPER
jgi:hypothetical protein